MKHIICFITILFIALTGELFGQYTVQLRFSQVTRSQNQQEWDVYIFADVFDINNNLVPASVANQYDYYWYRDICKGSGYSPYISGTGMSELHLDGMWNKKPQNADCCNECHYESYMLFVRVEINGQEYTSGEVRAPDNGLENILPRDTIVVDQKRLNNTTDGYIGRGYEYAQGIYNYPAPDTFYNRAGQSEIFQGSQELFTNPNEKYNHWENINDVVNYRSFTITSPQPKLVARLGPVYNATIGTELISANQMNAGYVEFKDPWLIDFEDQY